MPTNNRRSPVRYKRGYSPPQDSRDFIAHCHKTNLFRTMTAAVTDHLIAVAAVCAAAFGLSYLSFWVSGLLTVLALVITARQLRALECLAHEASHFNWSRSRRRLNDVLATVLAGVPTGVRIKTYRDSHHLHHGVFGTNRDPDWIRYQELEIEGIHRGRVIPFAQAVIRRLPRYQLGWLHSFSAEPLHLVLSIAYPLVLLVPALIRFSGIVAMLAAGLWLMSYLFVLPIIRFIGESNEHQYIDARTVFGATITNIGWLQNLLIHPHNDGYHTVHHLWPGVPHFALARLHRHLLAVDPICYASSLRYRTRLLESPRRNSYGCALERLVS